MASAVMIPLTADMVSFGKSNFRTPLALPFGFSTYTSSAMSIAVESVLFLYSWIAGDSKYRRFGA